MKLLAAWSAEGKEWTPTAWVSEDEGGGCLAMSDES